MLHQSIPCSWNVLLELAGEGVKAMCRSTQHVIILNCPFGWDFKLFFFFRVGGWAPARWNSNTNWKPIIVILVLCTLRGLMSTKRTATTSTQRGSLNYYYYYYYFNKKMVTFLTYDFNKKWVTVLRNMAQGYQQTWYLLYYYYHWPSSTNHQPSKNW